MICYVKSIPKRTYQIKVNFGMIGEVAAIGIFKDTNKFDI